MRKTLWILAALGVLAETATSALESHAAPLEHRWVYLATNLLVDKNVEDALALLDRAAKAGYNGVVLTDSKFMRWDQLPERYVQNVRRVRQACRDHKLACIACVCPIGYANDLLCRDPNLAEGLPVVDAPFVAKGGRLVPADDSARLVNGGFEQSQEQHAHRLELRGPAGQDHLHRHGRAVRGPRLAADAGHRPARSPARPRPGLPDARGQAVPLLPRLGGRQDPGLRVRRGGPDRRARPRTAPR